MRPSLLFAVTLVSVSFTEGLLAPSASACAAIPPGVLSTIPAAGTKTYPANAAIRLNGEGLSLAGLSATVGGKPAVVVAREGAVPPLGLALDLQPAPAPGELVTVAGALCKNGNNAPFTCAIDIAYTASEADTVAPAPAPAVSYDVHDYVDFKSSGGDCQSDSDLALWVNLPAPTDVAPYEYWLVELRKANAPTPAQTAVLTRSDTGPSTFAFRLSKAKVPDLSNGAICIRVVAVDLAGNASSSVETCSPCHARTETKAPVDDSFGPPTNPTWTKADEVPGGSCPASLSGTGGGTGTVGNGADAGLSPVSPQPRDGCSVGAAGAEQEGMSTLFGLGVLGLGAYAQGRRRSRGE